MLFLNKIFELHKVKLPDDNLKYKILSTADIINKEIGGLADQSMEIFGSKNVSPQDCQKLLFEFKWDYDRMLQKFLEADSFDGFLSNNKIDLSVPLPSKMMIDSFMQAKPLNKWCPNKQNGCKKAVKIDTSDVQDIACECGIEYCLQCLDAPHSQFPCVLLQEWVIQRDEFAFILEQNNVICPECRQFYSCNKLTDHFTCLCCSYYFCAFNNRLTRLNYPDYSEYLYALQDFEEIAAKKDALIGVKDVEFTSTVYKVTLNLLQQLLPVHAFSFYLDKEYLLKDSPTPNNVPLFDFHRKELSPLFNALMQQIKRISGVPDYLIAEKLQHEILEALHSLQQHLDKFFEFIKKTDGWIFKLPEIQQAYPDGDEDDNDDEEEEDLIGEEEDVEDLIDDEEGMEEITIVAADDEDFEEEANGEEESFVDVCA